MGAAVSAVSAIATVATVVARCLGAFREAPQAANSTVDQIERHAMEEARKQAAEAKKKEEEARKQAAEAKKKEEEARKKVEASKKKEQEANRHADEARSREQAANQREHEARQREEQVRNEKARLEEEAEAARAREEEARRQAEEARQNLAQGIQPVVWPTAQELADAKRNAGYRGDLLHFAVCGPSGSGKSSLINALRGLRNNQQGAAKTGVVECTEKMQRYPDLRKEMPYPRFVWYDVPGAGTSKIPGWQYFIQQGLFIFDFIVLVYDVVFTPPPPNERKTFFGGLYAD
jgi:ATP-dependent Clp protease ATP-binding subunit ClpA